MVQWNLWHGCHKHSPGCAHCYVFRRDESLGKDSNLVHKTANFGLPLQVKRDGSYKVPPGSMVWTCFTSDFFVEDADPWREEAWDMMRQRRDCTFFFITKRIHRMADCLPQDWGAGYPNVRVCCTVEDQKRAEYRLPILKKIPAAAKYLACEPLLEHLDLSPWLGPWLRQVTVGGESGRGARPCDFDWVLDIRRQCQAARVGFCYHQTGTRLLKDGKSYYIPRQFHHIQAHKAGIDWSPPQKRQQELVYARPSLFEINDDEEQ